MKHLLLIIFFAASGVAQAAPRVVASIAPIHSLAANIMAGAGEPDLLLKGFASPHHFNLKPSATRMLGAADLLLWTGPELEMFLIKPAAQSKAVSLAMLETTGLTRYPRRGGGAWEIDDHETGSPADVDPHFWLNPNNARIAATAIADQLMVLDPSNAALYKDNLSKLDMKLEQFDSQIGNRLEAFSRTPYLVFHDGYQYFEKYYGLNAIGSVVFEPDQTPGAKRIHEIRERVKAGGAVCLFAEPQFQSRLVQTISEGTDIRIGFLDPIGAELEPSPGLYFELMNGLAISLGDCLLNG